MAYRPMTEPESRSLFRIIQEGEQAKRKLYDRIMTLHADGVTSDELAEVVGVSRATLYRLMQEMRD